MNIAVILCTYNRHQSLARALESLAASSMPETAQWHVLVIDNNSTDETRSVVEKFAHLFPGRFEYLFEARQGKSHALNLGIQHANADVLAFTDDDVQVDPGWLQSITAPLDSQEWSGCGGRILPETGFTPPAWLDVNARYSLAPLAMFDPAMPGSELSEPPFGANMAYRSAMFSKHGGFRLDLGPQPGGEIKNEDVEFGSRLLHAGEHLRYQPDAVVFHSVPRHRVSKSYFLAWWHGKARSDIRQAGQARMDIDPRFSVFGIPLVLFRRILAWTVRWLISVNPARRFTCKVKVWEVFGYIQECAAQSRRTRLHRASQPQGTP